MHDRRLLLIAAAILLAGSLAIGAMWQTGGGDRVPASRSIFPKVLNH